MTDNLECTTHGGRPGSPATDPEQARPLYAIAKEIRATWQKVNYAAVPYLEAMLQLESINDRYYCDDAKSIVIYFLSNARTWRGDDARRIKAELKALYS